LVLQAPFQDYSLASLFYSKILRKPDNTKPKGAFEQIAGHFKAGKARLAVFSLESSRHPSICNFQAIWADWGLNSLQLPGTYILK